MHSTECSHSILLQFLKYITTGKSATKYCAPLLQQAHGRENADEVIVALQSERGIHGHNSL